MNVARNEPLVLATPHGPAQAYVHHPEDQRAGGAVILGHGAGGGVTAPDLVATTQVALELGFAVALTEQPYRVAGRKSAAPIAQCDVAFAAIVAGLREGPLAGIEHVITGGRSMGARIACRTSAETGARGVICLAFPLVPPRRRADGTPPPTRLPELRAVQVPVLVVQGESDPFGMPPRGRGRRVVKLAGDHGLKKDMPGLRAAVRRWLSDQAHAGSQG